MSCNSKNQKNSARIGGSHMRCTARNWLQARIKLSLTAWRSVNQGRSGQPSERNSSTPKECSCLRSCWTKLRLLTIPRSLCQLKPIEISRRRKSEYPVGITLKGIVGLAIMIWLSMRIVLVRAINDTHQGLLRLPLSLAQDSRPNIQSKIISKQHASTHHFLSEKVVKHSQDLTSSWEVHKKAPSLLMIIMNIINLIKTQSLFERAHDSSINPSLDVK